MKRIFSLLPICFFLSCQKHPAPQLVSKGDPREVAKNPSEVVNEVQSLDLLKKLRFSNSTLFLWKENQSELDLTNAIRNLRKYDDVEDDSFDYSSLTAQLEDLKNKKTELQNKAKQASQAEPKVSDEDLQKILNQIPALEKSEKVAETAKANLLSKYQSEEAFFAEMEKNESRLETLFKVVDTVETSNPVFSFDLNKEVLALGISGVSFVAGQTPKNFSTSDGSITNIEFKTEGALLNFDVQAAQNLRFEFRLRRTNYQDKAGRIIFKGDLKRLTIDSKGSVIEKRIGQAKLSTNPRL